MELSAYTPDEPIAAIATGLVPAALGVIRASGKDAVERAARIFSRPEALLNAKGGTIHHGWILANGADCRTVVDEVMAAIFRAPRSFTGEDTVEFFCHGGLSVVRGIYELLLEQGFREALPGEFTFRAFINGKTDLTRAEAVREIIEAKTPVSRQKAAGRLAGSLHKELTVVRELLLTSLASIEAEIEYPEDEHSFAENEFDVQSLLDAEKKLAALCDSWVSEKLYQEGARVVLCGKTNAGKSSLFNALLKEERAIVSAIPGTTRDWIEGEASFGGVPVTLFDTAGLRDSLDAIEHEGVLRAKNLLFQADVVVYVIDSSVEVSREDEDFLAAFEKDFAAPLIIALNKSDVTQSVPEGGVAATGTPHASVSVAWRGAGGRLPPPKHEKIFVSAKTGEGIKRLVAAVSKALGVMARTQNDSPALGSARQKKACEEARDSARHALSAHGGFTLDAVAADIEDALYSLSEITGAVTPDDILDTVFSKFCLGK